MRRVLDQRKAGKGVVTILILTLLLVVWVVVLGPGLWRRHTAQHAVDSVHTFRRALRALRLVQETMPALVSPANQLRADGVHNPGWRPAGSGPTRLWLVPDGAAPRPPVDRAPRTPSGQWTSVGGGSRASTRKRRRDVLMGLVASTVGAAVLGAMPPLHPLLVVAMIAAMLAVGYMVLLVRLRIAEAEQAQRRATRARAIRPPAGSPMAANGVGGPRQAEPELPAAQVAAR